MDNPPVTIILIMNYLSRKKVGVRLPGSSLPNPDKNRVPVIRMGKTIGTDFEKSRDGGEKKFHLQLSEIRMENSE